MRWTDCRHPAFCSRYQSRNTSPRTCPCATGSELHPCRILFYPPLPVRCYAVYADQSSLMYALSRLALHSFLPLSESTVVPRAPGIPLSGPARAGRIRDVLACNTRICRSIDGVPGLLRSAVCASVTLPPLLANILGPLLVRIWFRPVVLRCCFGWLEIDLPHIHFST